jgi:hypothetical protein
MFVRFESANRLTPLHPELLFDSRWLRAFARLDTITPAANLWPRRTSGAAHSLGSSWHAALPPAPPPSRRIPSAVLRCTSWLSITLERTHLIAGSFP